MINWFPDYWTPLERERLFSFWRERYFNNTANYSRYCVSQGGFGFFDTVLVFKNLPTTLSEKEKQIKLLEKYEDRKDSLLREFYSNELQVEDKRRIALLLFAEEKGFEFWQAQYLHKYNKDDLPEYIKFAKETIELSEHIYKAALGDLINYDRNCLRLATDPNYDGKEITFREKLLWFSRNGRRLEMEKLIREEIETNPTLKKELTSKYLLLAELNKNNRRPMSLNGDQVTINIGGHYNLENFYSNPIEDQIKEILSYEQFNLDNNAPEILIKSDSYSKDKAKFNRFRKLGYYPKKQIDLHLKKLAQDKLHFKNRLKSGFNMVNGFIEKSVITLKEPKIKSLSDKIAYFNKEEVVDKDSVYYAVQKDLLDSFENDPVYLAKVLEENRGLKNGVQRLIELRKNNRSILDGKDLNGDVELIHFKNEKVVKSKINISKEISRIHNISSTKDKLIHSRDFNSRQIANQSPINMTEQELEDLQKNQNLLKGSVLINDEEFEFLSSYIRQQRINLNSEIEDEESGDGEEDIQIIFEDGNGLFERDAQIKKYTKGMRRSRVFMLFGKPFFKNVVEQVANFKNKAEHIFNHKVSPNIGLETTKQRALDKVTNFEFKKAISSVTKLFALRKDENLELKRNQAPSPFK